MTQDQKTSLMEEEEEGEDEEVEEREEDKNKEMKYSYNKSQRGALFLKFILIKNSKYFEQICCP